MEHTENDGRRNVLLPGLNLKKRVEQQLLHGIIEHHGEGCWSRGETEVVLAVGTEGELVPPTTAITSLAQRSLQPRFQA